MQKLITTTIKTTITAMALGLLSTQSLAANESSETRLLKQYADLGYRCANYSGQERELRNHIDISRLDWTDSAYLCSRTKTFGEMLANHILVFRADGSFRTADAYRVAAYKPNSYYTKQE